MRNFVLHAEYLLDVMHHCSAGLWLKTLTKWCWWKSF